MMTSGVGLSSSGKAAANVTRNVGAYVAANRGPDGSSSELLMGVVPSQAGPVPRGPLFVAKSKPTGTNLVVGQLSANWRARVVNDVGSVSRLGGQKEGGLPGRLG
jgi:hypothetical protein